MSNDYYNAATKISRQSKAISSQVNSILDAIAAGFELLPGKDNLNQGKVTYAADTGTVNSLVASLPTPLTSYPTGLQVAIKVANTSTGSPTINIDGLGARSIKRIDGTDLSAGELTAGDIHQFVYDGTVFVMLSPSRAHMAGIANNLAADLVFSGDPSFTGSPDFSAAANKSTIRSDLGLEILGTVSESAGVPTGALMEKGSNSNGEYMRFANGLQVCWHTVTGIACTTATGSSLYRSGTQTWTFPAEFLIGTNQFKSGRIGNAPAGVAVHMPYNNNIQATSIVAYAYNSIASADLRYFAIGSWF